ncbi:formate dehydrogenase accessory protein FdhE [Xanthobacter dioxanivorans]|uniref:Protein FdhE homolog n=1 Tax=Xanthobacter dioxanivorans TaxID=2528964 RepID=A0A974PJ42_9HYPH|nr:formate dehydrogenase accessory protein FdhE [Xanthobacter dioxanivorans]QRG04499.1 formate dehydrogenase accessory protein FdhE [Xanthobacter dioxanivorans]
MSRLSGPPGAAIPDPSVLEGVTAPAFAHLPDPTTLFERRAARFRHLAAGNPLGPYLAFLGHVCTAQQRAAGAAPQPEPPDAPTLERAHTHHMPPLDRARFTADAAFDAVFERLLSEAAAMDKPAQAAAALERLRAASDVARGEMVRNVLADSIPMEALAEHLYVSAALQVHFTRLAASLDAASLVPVGDGVCPTCGGPPVASLVVDWAGAHGARYCACSLCNTLWNFVRVRCTACGSTGGIGYQEMEGGNGSVKAETCDACHSYAKVLYLAQDGGLDPVADDVASLGLDLKQKEGPYRRSAFNPFLLGY